MVSKRMQSGSYSLPMIELFTTTGIPPAVIGSSNRLNLQVLEPPSLLEQWTNYLFVQLSSSAPFIISILVLVTAVVTRVILSVVNMSKSAVIQKLDITDVIQIDATVIVGVLILLTLTSSLHTTIGSSYHIVVGVVIASIVCPFTLSAMIVTIKGTVEHGIKLTFSGFVYLMVAVLFLSLYL